MSRREDRSSDSRRHRSRFDREPSPKRTRRDDKMERRADTNLDKDRNLDQKHHRQLRDPLPVEASLVNVSNVETVTMGKDTDNRINGPLEGIKNLSDPTKLPQSRSYFQHDDRGSLGKNGRSFSRRTDKEQGWRRDSKEHQNDRIEAKTVTSDATDEKFRTSRDDNCVWRHDGYFQMEGHPKPPTHKRPGFREQKAPPDLEKTDKAAVDNTVESGRDERRFNSERSDRPERSIATGGSRGRYGGASRGRYSGGSSRYRDGERFNARQGYQPSGGRMEKWKHDLYDEANKDTNPKDDEDRISKIEALLAS